MSNRHTNEQSKTQSGSRSRVRRLPILIVLAFLGLGAVVASRIGGEKNKPAADIDQIKIESSTSSDPGTDSPESASPDSVSSDAARFGDRIVGLVSTEKIAAAQHPIDPLLELATEGLRRISENINGYTAVIVSQTNVGGMVQPQKKMLCKIRHASNENDPDGNPVTPFSVYLKMLSPDSVAGQEVIWVEGQNNNKLIAHATGMLNVKRVYLEPSGAMAMKGSRYPIWDIGFKNLLAKMKQSGAKDRLYDECIVKIDRDVSVEGRPCTRVTLTHPVKRPHFEQHIAKIYIDQAIDVLVGYEGYLWPDEPGGEPVLIEKYFYTDLKINPGLTGKDFSPSNPDYQYPNW